jgi:flagellar basal-body rod protein FlgC
MDFFGAMEISASGLDAERVRMNVAASNLANVHTTRTADGGPYKRRDVILAAVAAEEGLAPEAPDSDGARVFRVEAAEIVEDQSPPRLAYDPSHPDANAEGYVAMPNVNVVEEMVDMITATRAYEAGVSALKSASAMAEGALNIGR